MADIRINSLSTTASASSSDDFIALDGTTNGTRKLNAYSPTFGGNLTVSGTGTFSNTLTASKGLEAGIDGTASQFSGNIAVNNGKGVFLYEPGTTTWLRFYSSTAGTLLLTDASATRQTWTSTGSTLAGNLTVSGNGLNTFGGTGATNASILFGANNVANTAAGYLSISQRLNYGYALFGYNMTGTSGSDAYTSPKNATGSAGVELIGGSSGITRFIYSTAATTAGNALTVTEAARFSSGNLLLGTTTDGGQKLQVAGTAEIQSTLTVKGAEAGPTTGISSIIQNTTSANDRVAALRLVNASNQWNLRAVGSGDTFSIGPGLSGSETNYFTLSSTGNATFAGAILSVGSGSNNAVCRVTASNGKTSDLGDDTTGGFVRANNSQSLRFITNSIAAITIDTSQDTTFAGQIVATKTTGAFRIATAETPASASATGTIGTIAWDTSYIYVCTAANTWKRVAIATW